MNVALNKCHIYTSSLMSYIYVIVYHFHCILCVVLKQYPVNFVF